MHLPDATHADERNAQHVRGHADTPRQTHSHRRCAAAWRVSTKEDGSCRPIAWRHVERCNEAPRAAAWRSSKTLQEPVRPIDWRHVESCNEAPRAAAWRVSTKEDES